MRQMNPPIAGSEPDIEATLRALRSKLDPAFVRAARQPASTQGLWRSYAAMRPQALTGTAQMLARIPDPLVNKAVRRRREVIKKVREGFSTGVLGVRSVRSGGAPTLGKRR